MCFCFVAAICWLDPSIQANLARPRWTGVREMREFLEDAVASSGPNFKTWWRKGKEVALFTFFPENSKKSYKQELFLLY